MIAYHDHNESTQSQKIVQRMLKDDLRVALVSDAGTPCVSDPGYRLVRAAHEAGIKVHPVPGASAFISLVSASGLASNRLIFEGFLPVKSGQLEKQISSWAGLKGSIVFFESARRLEKTLGVVASIYPNGRCAIGRELTKMYEEVLHLKLDKAVEWAHEHTSLKGEVVVMIETGDVSVEITEDHIKDMGREKFKAGLSHKGALKEILVELDGAGPPKGDIYQLLLAVKEE
jgi:16S rRNA (cytidine1402-2'-O)-methyltransferase